MKTLPVSRKHLLAACALAALPMVTMAGDGPYIGAEAGVNFLKSQSGANFNTGWIGGGTAGYSFANGLRPELELDLRRNELDQIGGVKGNGHVKAGTAMANLWYDINGIGLPSALHPYIGAGIGYARTSVDNLTPGGVSGGGNRFAYQAGAGVGYDVTRNLTASLDYRFLRDGHDNVTVGGVPAEARYQTQAIMAGLRYSFGAAPVAMAAAAPVAAAAVAARPALSPAPVCNPPAGLKVDANCHIIPQELVIRSVDFKLNSDQLTGPARHTLDEVASALATQPELNVEVQGHTDSTGSAAYNLKLSQRRADSVKTYLVSKGVNGANLTAKGFGQTHPIASNKTVEGRAQNRRVQFEVTNAPRHVKVINEGASAASTDAALQGQQAEKHHHRKHHHKKAAAAPAAASAQQ